LIIIKAGIVKLLIILVIGLFGVLLLSRYAMISFRKDNAVFNANTITKSALINAHDNSVRTIKETFKFDRPEFETNFIKLWHEHSGTNTFEFEFDYLENSENSENENGVVAVRVIITHENGKIYATQILNLME